MAAVRYELRRVARKRGHEGQIWYSSDKSTNHLQQGRENIAKALCGPHLPIKEDILGRVRINICFWSTELDIDLSYSITIPAR